jgi:hypothetical protein
MILKAIDGSKHRKLSLELKLHVACFWKILKHVLKFQKTLDVVTDVFYKYVKFEGKRLHTLGYTKMTNSDKF